MNFTFFVFIAVKSTNQCAYFPHEQPIHCADTRLCSALITKFVKDRFFPIYPWTPILRLSRNYQSFGTPFGLMDCCWNSPGSVYIHCSSIKVKHIVMGRDKNCRESSVSVISCFTI